MTPYESAQIALAQLKAAVYELLKSGPKNGLTNVQVGKSLGIYHGHKGHEGHISRTILGLMEEEGVVYQAEKDKKWLLRLHESSSDA